MLGILERPYTVVLVACVPTEEDALLGFGAFTAACDDTGPVQPVIHYLYTKVGARRLGIARAICGPCEAMPCEYTHLPVVRGNLVPQAWTYNPYMAR